MAKWTITVVGRGRAWVDGGKRECGQPTGCKGSWHIKNSNSAVKSVKSMQDVKAYMLILAR